MKNHKYAFFTLTFLALLGLLPYLLAATEPVVLGMKVPDNSFRFIRNFLPDFLWAAGFAFTLHWIKDSLSFSKRWLNINLLAALTLSTLLEIAQHKELIPGTADYFDCLMYVAGLIFGTVTYFIQTKSQHTSSNTKFS